MGQQPTKAMSNVYCKARLEASKWNSNFSSRKSASELLGISEYSLGDYELGNTIPPCDKVNLMADIYNAPKLKNYYCANECPIGKTEVKELEEKDFDRTTIEALFSLSTASKIKDTLLEITADGVIEANEEDKLLDIVKFFEELEKIGKELKLSIEKNKNERN